jgi:hypothetical protein
MASSQCIAAFAEWRSAHSHTFTPDMANCLSPGVRGRNAKPEGTIEEETAQDEDAMEV